MIDLILGLVILGYAISGFRQGFAVGVLSLGGFVTGAVIAMMVVPPLADGLAAGLQRSFVILAAVLLFAWLGQLGGALIGARLRDRLTIRTVRFADQLLGALSGIVAVALVLWFVGGALRVSPSPALARAIANSQVLGAIDAVVPEPVVVFAEGFRRAVAASEFPRVFAGVAPEEIVPASKPQPDVMPAAVLARAQRSIVKITGDAPACARSIEGSGAVIAGQRVDHQCPRCRRDADAVRAGRWPGCAATGRRWCCSTRSVTSPSWPCRSSPPRHWRPGTTSGAGRTPWWPASRERVLHNPGPAQGAVGAAGQRQRHLRATPGANRQVYQLYAKVEPGNSGGPLLDASGALAGVVFAKSLDDAKTGYALTFDEIKSDLIAGIGSSRPVSTRACASG